MDFFMLKPEPVSVYDISQGSGTRTVQWGIGIKLFKKDIRK